MDEDKLLMKEFQDGNKKSFEKIIIKYRASAISFAERYIHDRYMAEDIVQESFAYLYVYRDRYNSKYSLKTYLFTIIRNKSIDYFRKNSKVDLWEECYMMDKMRDNIGDSKNNLEEIILKREENNMLKENIKKLKIEYQTAIYLIDYEEFSYKEAAKIMNKNLAQMKILVFRARRKLRTFIEGEA